MSEELRECPFCGNAGKVKRMSKFLGGVLQGHETVVLTQDEINNPYADIRTMIEDKKRKQEQIKKTMFHHITQSQEVLAENLVYRYDGNGTWRSFLLYGYEFLTKEEAYAATVAKLNEVCVEQNAVDYTQARLSKVDDTKKEVEK
jgi:hypothetical protein